MVVKRAVGAALALLVLAGAAQAQSKPKVNGDSGSDLAPLDTSGTSANEGAMAKGNTPPIGGNPNESGPVDAARTGKTGRGDKNQQPDNK